MNVIWGSLESWDALDRRTHRCAREGCCRHDRLPLQPLLELAKLPPSTLGRKLKANSHTITRWRTIGMKPEQADRAAVTLGLHPASIWGEQWWEL